MKEKIPHFCTSSKIQRATFNNGAMFRKKICGNDKKFNYKLKLLKK